MRKVETRQEKHERRQARVAARKAIKNQHPTKMVEESIALNRKINRLEAEEAECDNRYADGKSLPKAERIALHMELNKHMEEVRKATQSLYNEECKAIWADVEGV